MSYSFKLKNGEIAIFDAENSILSITSVHGEINRSTLGRAESRLLSLLLSDPGATKSRNEIVEYVWDDRVVASGSLNQAIFSLRNTLNDSREHEILMTVPRRGYRFNRDYLVNSMANEPEPALPETAADPLQPISPPPSNESPFFNAPPPKKKRKINSLMVGYALLAPLTVITILHITPFGSSNVAASKLEIGAVTLNFVGTDSNNAATLKKSLSAQLKNFPEKLNGNVWISSDKTSYSISCIRTDQSTLNLQYETNQIELQKMIQQCLEQPI
ncbi:transcriptional regulator [Pseudomonas sp. NPDC098747]|uniref:transcriptional regulator n=1 Tax=Pseudomonas sp. NPDC098747 TaxID=3364487 RepID=UPI00383BAFD9